MLTTCKRVNPSSLPSSSCNTEDENDLPEIGGIHKEILEVNPVPRSPPRTRWVSRS